MEIPYHHTEVGKRGRMTDLTSTLPSSTTSVEPNLPFSESTFPVSVFYLSWTQVQVTPVCLVRSWWFNPKRNSLCICNENKFGDSKDLETVSVT